MISRNYILGMIASEEMLNIEWKFWSVADYLSSFLHINQSDDSNILMAFQDAINSDIGLPKAACCCKSWQTEGDRQHAHIRGHGQHDKDLVRVRDEGR
jgi:hypothetical protein